MHHHTQPIRTSPAALLLAKVNRHEMQPPAMFMKTNVNAIESPAPDARSTFYGGLIGESHTGMVKAARLAKAAQVATAGRPPASLVVKKPLMFAPGEGASFEAGLDLDDPRHVHAAQLRASANAHTSLLASIKAAHNATPNRHPSTGPEAL